MRLTGYRSEGFVWQLCSDTRISDVSRHLPVAATQLFMREETTSSKVGFQTVTCGENT